MPDSSMKAISSLLNQHQASISSAWMAEVSRVWVRQYPGLVSESELRLQSDALFKALTQVFADATATTPPVVDAQCSLGTIVVTMSTEWAKKGFKPVDTALYVIALKNVLTQHLVRELSGYPSMLTEGLRQVDNVLDRLSLLTFESIVETRERVIAQQSVSLMELSTPVILLWNHVLLLPLVGVIDTIRARQFTERLLEAITRHEASVTLIDVTGVPVFDTSVARHIMKTIDAAQLLGSRIVMTGISPEGAQTLTKLGISFANVISRATLRAGVAEAMQLIGRRIVAVGGERP